MHSFVKHDIVVKTGCTTVAAPVLSVTLADENTVVSDSLACLDLTAVVDAGTEYSMPGVPCRVLPYLTSDVILGMDWLRKYNPHIDWVDPQLCFDDAGTARCLHACTQDTDGLDGCIIVPGCTVP